MPLWWLRFRSWLHSPPHIVQFADGSYGLRRCCFGPLFRELKGSSWLVRPWSGCRTKDEALIRRVAEDPWNVGIEVSFPPSVSSPEVRPTPRPSHD